MTDKALKERVLNVGKQVALMSYLRANIRAQHFLQYVENFASPRTSSSLNALVSPPQSRDRTAPHADVSSSK